MKYLYVIDHFVPFPQSEYGGVWNVIAKDDEFNIGCYTKLRENIKKSTKYALMDDESSKVVSSFLT